MLPKKLNKILIFVTIALIPTYLIRFAVFGIPTNILEVLILINFILYLLSEKPPIKKFCRSNRIISWAVLAIFMGLLISTLANENWRVGFGIIKGWFVVPVIFSWVAYVSAKNEENLTVALKWLYWGIFGVAIISLGYCLFGSLTYDGRLRGFYLSPNYLAMYLAPGIFIGWYLIQSLKLKVQNHNSRLKVFYLLALMVIIGSLYLTYSYAAWLSVVFSLAITYSIQNKKINRRMVLAGLIILLLIFISQWNTEKLINIKNFSRSSIESRIMIWKAAGRILSDNPVWGIGPGNFQDKYLEYQKHFPPYLEWAVPQPHNIYLAFWLQAGLLGLFGFLVITVKWLKDLIQAQKNSQLAITLLAIMAYILIHGLLDTPYWKNDLALIFWIVIFLGLKLKELSPD